MTSTHPTQGRFSLLLETFLSMFVIQRSFMRILKTINKKLICMIKQRCKYLQLSYLIGNSLTKMRKHPELLYLTGLHCPLTFTLGTCLCPRLVGVTGNDSLALEQKAFSTPDGHILVHIKLLFREQSILRNDKRDGAWVCC